MYKTKFLLTLLVVVFWWAGVASGLEDHYDYFSLYQIPQVVPFCSADPNHPKASYCKIDRCREAYDCGGTHCEELPHLCVSYRTGFKNILDFNDPLVCLGEDISTEGFFCDPALPRYSGSTMRSMTLWAPDQFGENFGHTWGHAGKLSRFRVFIPPGSKNFGLIIYLPPNTCTGFVFRYGRPPDCKFCDDQKWPEDTVPDLPGFSYHDLTLDIARDHDVYINNSGGHVQFKPLMTDRSPEGEPFVVYSPERAGWLYVRLVPRTYASCGSDWINIISVNTELDLEAFMSWFEQVSWDEYGDPPPGEFASEGSSCQSPEECTTPYACGSVGGVWCGDSCHPAAACPVCCGNTCYSKEDCPYCCEGQCQEDPCSPPPESPGNDDSSSVSSETSFDTTEVCSATNLSACKNSYECAEVGGEWCDNACHPKGECPSSSSPSSSSSGVSGLDLLHQYASGTSGEPSAPSSPSSPLTSLVCSATNLSACKNSYECAEVGGEWCDNACHPKGECSPTSYVSYEGPSAVSGLEPPQAPCQVDCNVTECSAERDPVVEVSKDVLSEDDTLILSFKVPAYSQPVKVALAIERADGQWVFYRFENNQWMEEVTESLDPIPFRELAAGESIEDTVVQAPVVAKALGFRQLLLVPGEYHVYWLVTPAEGGVETLADIEAGQKPYKLFHRSFRVVLGDGG